MSVLSTIHSLGIKIHHQNSKTIRVRCILPGHNDSDPSCDIDINSGVIYCHGCKRSTNIVKFYQDKFGGSYADAHKIIFGYDLVPRNARVEQEPVKEKPKVYQSDIDLCTIPLNLKCQYLEDRGLTQEYVDTFHQELCVSHPHVDFMMTPIVSEKLNIKLYELRKIYQLEYLQKLFKSKSKSLKRLQAKFKQEKAEHKDSIYYEYITKSKNFYPPHAGVHALIYNFDNLDFNDDLVLVEGIPGTFKIWNQLTKNITCTFGTSLSNEQIKLLKMFKKRLIFISDNDDASYKFIAKVNKYFNNAYVFDCITEDTDEDHIQKIKQSKILKSNEFLISRKYFNFE